MEVGQERADDQGSAPGSLCKQEGVERGGGEGLGWKGSIWLSLLGVESGYDVRLRGRMSVPVCRSHGLPFLVGILLSFKTLLVDLPSLGASARDTLAFLPLIMGTSSSSVLVGGWVGGLVGK